MNLEGPVLPIPLVTQLILLASLRISAMAGLMQASTHLMHTMSDLKPVLHVFTFLPQKGSSDIDVKIPSSQACVSSLKSVGYSNQQETGAYR